MTRRGEPAASDAIRARSDGGGPDPAVGGSGANPAAGSGEAHPAAEAGARALYRELLVEHAKHPRNRRRLDGDARVAEADNPLCGDRVTVYARVDGDVLRELAFEAAACAVVTASASMMTDLLKGRSGEDAARLARSFAAFLAAGSPGAGGAAPDADESGPLPGELEAFAGVREFPSRVRCALLPWRALERALGDPTRRSP